MQNLKFKLYMLNLKQSNLNRADQASEAFWHSTDDGDTNAEIYKLIVIRVY